MAKSLVSGSQPALPIASVWQPREARTQWGCPDQAEKGGHPGRVWKGTNMCADCLSVWELFREWADQGWGGRAACLGRRAGVRLHRPGTRALRAPQRREHILRLTKQRGNPGQPGMKMERK